MPDIRDDEEELDEEPTDEEEEPTDEEEEELEEDEPEEPEKEDYEADSIEALVYMLSEDFNPDDYSGININIYVVRNLLDEDFSETGDNYKQGELREFIEKHEYMIASYKRVERAVEEHEYALDYSAAKNLIREYDVRRACSVLSNVSNISIDEDAFKLILETAKKDDVIEEHYVIDFISNALAYRSFGRGKAGTILEGVFKDYKAKDKSKLVAFLRDIDEDKADIDEAVTNSIKSRNPSTEEQKNYDNIENLDTSAVEYHPTIASLFALEKLCPVSLKDLRDKYSRLYGALLKDPTFMPFFGLKDMAKLSKEAARKQLEFQFTLEQVKKFAESLETDKHEIERGTWGGLQRSLAGKRDEQLVLIIKASARQLAKIKSEGAQEVFEYINKDMNDGNPHPTADNALGWARIEIAEDKSFLLVDEIQTDYPKEIKALLKTAESAIAREQAKIKEFEKEPDYVAELEAKVAKYEANKAGLEKLLAMVESEFPHIAMTVVQQVARKNGIKKIYSHTYEGGKKLKPTSDPPMHLYSEIPKKHYYQVTEDKPFNLPAQFFVKEARKLLRVAKKLAD